MGKFIVTPAHEAIFEQIQSRKRNLLINAVAGSGKSTTLLESLRFVHRRERVGMFAFARRNKDDLLYKLKVRSQDPKLKDSMPHNISVLTMNSMGWRAYSASMPFAVRFEERKLNRLVKGMENAEARGAVLKVTKLAKAFCIVPEGIPTQMAEGMNKDTDDVWAELIDHFAIEIPAEFTANQIIRASRKLLGISTRDQVNVDFDDQLFFPIIYGSAFPKYNRVYVDECQDLSQLQHLMIERSLAPGGQFVFVGDENQAIYGFRGADSDSVQKLEERFNCERLPLHVSYRCPKAIVELAQRYVPHIEAAPGNKEGVLDTQVKDFRRTDFEPDDFVVCRFNAPLVNVAYDLMRKGIKCMIMGKDIGEDLLALVQKLKSKTIEELLRNLAAWEEKEVSRLVRADKEDAAAVVSDRADTIRVFAEMEDTMPALEKRIATMFADAAEKSAIDEDGAPQPALRPGYVNLASIHKAKGLEAERVTILNFHELPCRWGKQAWQLQQEINAVYIAVTRSMGTLRFAVVPKPRK